MGNATIVPLSLVVLPLHVSRLRCIGLLNSALFPRSLVLQDTPHWSNWSGLVQSTPRKVARPRTVEDVQQLIQSTGRRIRSVGSGHSFTALAQTEAVLLTLESMDGTVLSTREEGGEHIATVQAGASLNWLSRHLQKEGLAFKNLGDIDVQSLAGATSTATHGTGKDFPCLAAEIRGLKLVTADGSLLTISADENSDLLHAAQVALGALGVIVEADVAVRPAYKLHRKTFIQPLKQTLAEAESRWQRHRNYEFFYLPYCDYAFNISHEETDEDDFSDAGGDDDDAVRSLKTLRNLTSWAPPLRRALINLVAKRHKTETMIGTSWEMLANVREVRFNEMEYHLPAKLGLAAFEELVDLIERKQRDVFFPVEVRRTAADDAWLSPFQDGSRISVAVHAFHKEAHDWFFRLAEPIFRKYQGRPHWGKLHSLKHDELREIYPDFERFLVLRRRLDPDGRFLNPYLASLWGESFS